MAILNGSRLRMHSRRLTTFGRVRKHKSERCIYLIWSAPLASSYRKVSFGSKGVREKCMQHSNDPPHFSLILSQLRGVFSLHLRESIVIAAWWNRAHVWPARRRMGDEFFAHATTYRGWECRLTLDWALLYHAEIVRRFLDKGIEPRAAAWMAFNNRQMQAAWDCASDVSDYALQKRTKSWENGLCMRHDLKDMGEWLGQWDYNPRYQQWHHFNYSRMRCRMVHGCASRLLFKQFYIELLNRTRRDYFWFRLMQRFLGLINKTRIQIVKKLHATRSNKFLCVFAKHSYYFNVYLHQISEKISLWTRNDSLDQYLWRTKKKHYGATRKSCGVSVLQSWRPLCARPSIP